jgi:type IV pilus assembly protein PilA
MEQQKDKKRKKLGNKGFSLVELIVVIAIMAILTGFVAPQVMHYIEDAREAADDSNKDTLKTAVEIALANENAYEEITGAVTFTIKEGQDPTESDYTSTTNFKAELKKIIPAWPKVKRKNFNTFTIQITADKEVIVTITKN